MAEREALLSLRNISKAYGSVRALDDVDFDVYPSEVLALVGDNGAGKTTLVKVIAGAHRPDRGEIYFDGVLRHFNSPLEVKRAGIEVVYQNLGLIENLSIAANVFLHRESRLKLLGRITTPFMNFREMNSETRAMLERYNVAIDSPKRLVSRLSGGQRQLVAIARGAGWGSRLLIMDEPTAALGIQESRKVLDLVRHLREQAVSVLIVSHNLEHVFEVADRVTVLRRGRVAGSLRTDTSSASDVVHLITGAAEVGTTKAVVDAEIAALATQHERESKEESIHRVADQVGVIDQVVTSEEKDR